MYKKYEQLLKKRNVCTAQVCRETGIAETVISNWKKRNGNLSFDNLAKIAKYFGVPLEYFVDEKKAKKQKAVRK